MIAIVLSVISLLVIIIVTVYLVNKNIDDESKRVSDMRKLVDQMNAANSNLAQIDVGQNTTLSDLNAAIARVNRGISTTNSNIAALQSNAVLKSDANAEIATSRIRMNNSIIAQNSNLITISTPANNRIVGFDTLGSGRRFTVGTELAILESGSSNLYSPFDASGDVFIMTQSNDKRLMLQSGSNVGLVVRGNRIGAGMDPKFSQLDVKNNLAVVGDSILMGVKEPKRVLSVGKFNEIIINEGSNYAGAVVEGDFAITNDLYVASGKIKGNYDTPMSIGADTDIEGSFSMYGSNVMRATPKTLDINPGNIRRDVVIGGRNISLGSTGFTQSNNGTNVFFGDGMRFASKSTTPQTWEFSLSNSRVTANNLHTSNLYTENAYTSRNIYTNTNGGRIWSSYVNNAGDYVADPSLQSLPSSTGNGQGVFRINANGDVFAKGSADFDGSISANGNIESDGNVKAEKLCINNGIVNGGGDICLTRDHIEWVISRFNNNRIN